MNGVTPKYLPQQAVDKVWGVQPATSPTATLRWDYGASVGVAFKVERSPNGSTNWVEIGSTSTSVTYYQDTGLAPYTNYYYRIRAYNATSTSAYSNVVKVTTP